MNVSKRPIFRNKMLQQYKQKRNKTVLPRFASPPVFPFFWILLGLLLMAGVTAWLGQVPIYVAGSGVILHPGSTVQQARDEAVAVIFVPATTSPKLRAGLAIQVQIGSTGSQLLGTLAMVEPGVISPSDARQRYGLGGDLASVITQPSYVATVKLGPTISAHLYTGSIVHAQVQVGTQRVLSLLPGLGTLFGG